MNALDHSTKCLTLLSQLLLQNDASSTASQDSGQQGALAKSVAGLNPQDFSELWSLANSHHVIARTFPRLHEITVAEKHERAG